MSLPSLRFLPHILTRSSRLLCIVDAEYFKRLWCVYELATFCRAHRADLRARLLLLSLRWPSTLQPFKRAELSAREEAWLANFSCLQARCYKPSDRARLLAAIRDQWRSEAAFDHFVRTELLQVLRDLRRRPCPPPMVG